MDKYFKILEYYDNGLEDLLYDYDIGPEDVLAALDAAGMIDCEEMYTRFYHGIEEEPDS